MPQVMTQTKTLTSLGVSRHQTYENQVALWMVTWFWNKWAIMIFSGLKTRGVFLYGCFISRKRREISWSWYFMSNVVKTKESWDKSSSRLRIVESACCRSSRFLRSRLKYGKRSDGGSRSQVHQKMERSSRAIQGICKENRWTQFSVLITFF